MKQTFRVLDGSSVTMSGPFPDLDRGKVSSFATYRTGLGELEFGGGGRDFALAAAAALGVSFTERYKLGSGSLRLGSVERIDASSGGRERVSLAAWEGRAWSIKAFLTNRHASDLIAAFDEFLVDETGEGAVLIPKDAQRTSLRRGLGAAPEVAMEVPGLGLVSVKERSAEVEGTLPPTAGTQSSSGQLYAMPDSGSQETVVLLTDTALSQVAVNGAASESQVIDALAQTSVVWTGRS